MSKAGRPVTRRQRYASHSFQSFQSSVPSVLGAPNPSGVVGDFLVIFGDVIARNLQVSPSPEKFSS